MLTLAQPASAGREEGVRGAQSVRRALTLLRLVARRGTTGARLAHLVRDSGLDRATAYRLLTCLVEEQFLQREDGQHYRLGPQALLLSSSMPSAAMLVSRFGPAMKRISRIAGDTAFLMIRKGDYVQCDHREVGGSLIRILTTDIGQRRLLGMGTGGAAVLGLMDDDEISATWSRHETEYLDHDISRDRLLAMARAVRVNDMLAITFDAVETGVAGIGKAFRLGTHAMGALSIGTLTARFGPERQLELAELLTAELKTLGLA
ncbi:IclR family transcriptional regulator [Caldimonas thermodepolymerans]|uniref:IclR family transcriptional regulator n=1 Tax=Caldimonas thermodepolymerans TaxID=215580 RepID=UPI002235DAC9|nr:helix-turn-helix domain-containing protein [Caldimonas thermodepolymerans]UZG44407.1 helix-turn-helix domain-containing protein [Caldimonas thermodepolymerans]